MKIRLDKYMSDSGLGTRASVKALLKTGSVLVNGEVCKDPSRKIESDSDVVTCEGKTVGYKEMEYIMLNKPAGVVTATRDKSASTVLDLIKGEHRRDLFPVGRLDKDTEGLLLITNDGRLSHDLLTPGKHVDKTYFVRVQGRITDDMVKAFEAGIDIGDEKDTAPAVLKVINSGEISEAEVTITEGRYHQVKRMFSAFDCEVIYLKRISMGGLSLDESLQPGEFRELTEEELKIL